MIFLIFLLFLIIILFSLKQSLRKDNRPYSINKFIWVYVFIFWGFAPLIQYIFKYFPWGVSVSDSMAIKANSFILLWMITYSIIYKKFSKGKKTELFPLSLKPFKLNRFGTNFLISIQIGIFIFFLTQYGTIFFLRGETIRTELIGGNQSIHLIINQVFRAVTTFITLVIFINYKANKFFIRFISLIISLFLLFLTNFPFAIPRYMAGAFYIALFFIYKPNFKRQNAVVFGLLILFLIIYPASSAFRYLTDFSNYNYLGSSIQTFLSGDFDNYATLNMTINYVEKHGITFGHQLLGTLLFFVPRSMWPDKPVGSGAFVAESRYMDFTNISSPIIAEGYINFGIFGIILFAAIIAYFSAKLDTKFYQYSKLTFIKLYYPVCLGLIFFILRGDLMSSFAYSVSFAVAALIVLMLVKPFIKYHKLNENPASN